MKLKYKIGVGIVLIFIALIVIIPAELGNAIYKTSAKVESIIYGLEKSQIDIGEMKLALYQNEIKQRETIVMLHGFSADKDNWLRFSKHFTDKYNVVIPDMAGHGETRFSKSWSYSGPAQASRLEKLLDKLNITKAHVIGNSMGGFIAAHFAINYPEKILSMALVDPAGVKSPKQSDMDKMLAKGSNPFEIYNREEFDDFYSMTMESPPLIPGVVFESISEKYKARREQLMYMFKDFHGQHQLDSSLNEIKIPSLLLWGAADKLIHVSSVENWKAGIKNLQTKIWQGIGHMPMLEIPSESAAVYEEFLQKVKQ